MNNSKTALSGLTIEELENFVTSIGEAKFRAKQIQHWLYKKHVSNFDEMNNVSKDFKQKLKENAVITNTKIKQKQVSSDGTVKYLLEFEDGNLIETVLMHFDDRTNLSVCVSTQVGCAVNCAFCATGKQGFTRNLTAQEIAEQVLTIQRDTKEKITNVVYMGQGEPLLNYDNVIKSIDIINKELVIGIRHITLSTSGIVPAIYKLADENKALVLAISLHAPNSALRKQIMPIENKYNLNELMKALKYWIDKVGRRITIEYTLIENINDNKEQAAELNKLLKSLKCNINLIPYNPTENDKFKKPSIKRINEFRKVLDQSNKNITVRLERGADIQAACGQLKGKFE